MTFDILVIVVWACGIPIALGVYREIVGKFDDPCTFMIVWPVLLAFVVGFGVLVGLVWIGRAPFVIARRLRRQSARGEGG